MEPNKQGAQQTLYCFLDGFTFTHKIHLATKYSSFNGAFNNILTTFTKTRI